MKKLLVVVVCLFCLSACSTKLAYNFMGFISKWYVGTYVSLDHEQKQLVESAIDVFKSWHRETQLPLYSDYIEGVITRIQQDDISGQWIHGETDQLQLLLDNSVNYLKPSIAKLMMSFSDEQTQEVLENLADDRKKYRKKHVDIDDKKRVKIQINELKSRLGPFFGRFTPEQKAWIEQWTAELKPYEKLTLEQQETWAGNVAEAFAVRNDKQQLRAKLEHVMFYRTDDWNPELQAALDFNQEITYDLVARLINSQSDKQRGKLVKKLTSYQQDFLELAKRK